MATQQQAEAVFQRLEQQLKQHPNFSGIEIAALEKDGVFTDDLCVRVLVNSASTTHDVLNIPKVMNGVPIQLRFSVVEPH